MSKLAHAPAFHRIVAVGAVIVVGLLAGTPAAADDRETCEKASGEVAIAACTREIASGRYKDHGLAVIYYNRGVEYGSKGQPDRAIQDYDQAIRLDPQYAKAFYNRGTTYATRKAQFDRADWMRADENFAQAIRLDPKHASALNNACEARVKLGRAEEALANCSDSLRLLPNDEDTLKNRGLSYLALKQNDQAIADCDAALRLNPKNVEALYGRGLAKRRKGDAAGGNADIAAAKSIQNDIVETFAQYGLK